MNIDRYKELSGIEVVYYNEDKITNIMQDKTNCLESLDYSSLQSAKKLAKDLGLETVTWIRTTRAIINLDGTKRGYHKFRKEANANE
jgi:hypothetical protein